MTRLADLQTVREGLMGRMADATSDQNYAVMGRLLLDVLEQIDSVGGKAGGAKETGLSDFEKRLRDRQQRAKAPRRAKIG